MLSDQLISSVSLCDGARSYSDPALSTQVDEEGKYFPFSWNTRSLREGKQDPPPHCSPVYVSHPFSSSFTKVLILNAVSRGNPPRQHSFATHNPGRRERRCRKGTMTRNQPIEMRSMPATPAPSYRSNAAGSVNAENELPSYTSTARPPPSYPPSPVLENPFSDRNKISAQATTCPVTPGDLEAGAQPAPSQPTAPAAAASSSAMPQQPTNNAPQVNNTAGIPARRPTQTVQSRSRQDGSHKRVRRIFCDHPYLASSGCLLWTALAFYIIWVCTLEK